MSGIITPIRPQGADGGRPPVSITGVQAPAAGRVFVARQPIFDPQQNVFGYELLFRSGLENFFNHADLDQASAKVMTDGAFLAGPAGIASGKLSFINVTRGILVKDYIHLLPRGMTAVEIPETIEPDAEVLEACGRLKDSGYLLVLDDFVYREEYAELMTMADIVKVDFLSTHADERERVLSRFRTPDVRFVAEKVGSHDVFQQALGMGYSFFQGYFFSKPAIISAQDVPGYKLNYLRMLQEIQLPSTDFRRLETIVKHDMALSYKLLRYVNSAYFGLKNKVGSILHAMMLLGPREFKQWASLLIMAGMGSDRPNELVIQGLIRGRFCESLAPRFGMKHQSQELFLLGMFSLVDVVLGRPLAEVLDHLPLAPEIKGALLGEPGRPRAVLDYALAYERGDWEKLLEIAGTLGLDETGVPLVYQAAVRWAEQSFEEVCAAA